MLTYVQIAGTHEQNDLSQNDNPILTQHTATGNKTKTMHVQRERDGNNQVHDSYRFVQMDVKRRV